MVFGHTQKGGPAATMQSAALRNERFGFIGKDNVITAGDQGVSVKEADVPGSRIVTESVAGQIVGQFVEPTPFIGAAIVEQNGVTIGQALEATAHTAGEKPVDLSDAAAIQAAEVRATGSNVIIPGGLASAAQSPATCNAGVRSAEDKIKLYHILMDAPTRLPADKLVTKDDAEGVMRAEQRHIVVGWRIVWLKYSGLTRICKRGRWIWIGLGDAKAEAAQGLGLFKVES